MSSINEINIYSSPLHPRRTWYLLRPEHSQVQRCNVINDVPFIDLSSATEKYLKPPFFAHYHCICTYSNAFRHWSICTVQSNIVNQAKIVNTNYTMLIFYLSLQLKNISTIIIDSSPLRLHIIRCLLAQIICRHSVDWLSPGLRKAYYQVLTYTLAFEVISI